MYLEATTWARVRFIKAKESIQSAVKKFFQDEQGDTNMISVIIILVIVVGLAVVFRKNIAAMATKMWETIFKDASEATGGGIEEGSSTPFN